MRTVITNKGFTLIELLIAIFVSVLLMAGIYSVFNSQLRVSQIQAQTANVQQNIRSAMYIMEREIRMSGYRGISDSSAGASAVTGFTAADATSMTFAYVKDNDGVDNNGNGTTDETGEVSSIVYTFNDSAIGRSVDGSAAISIAEDIQMIEFLYNEDMGATESTTPADTTLIETVTISILARSTGSVLNSSTGREYTTPSTDVWGDDEDYNDGFYRRYITSRIICRNLTSN